MHLNLSSKLSFGCRTRNYISIRGSIWPAKKLRRQSGWSSLAIYFQNAAIVPILLA
jgi:hypothetical protein